MKRKILFGFQIIITIIIFYFIIDRFNLFKSKISLPKGNIFLIFFCIINTLVLIPYFAAKRWKSILNQLDIFTNFSRLLYINFTSIFWGFMLPSSDGFAIFRAYQLEKKTYKKGVATSSIIIEKILGLFSLILITFISSIFFLKKELIFRKIALSSGLILTILLFLFVFIRKLDVNKIQFFKSQQAIILFFKTIYQTITQYSILKMYKKSFYYIFPVQILSIINVAIIFRMYGIEIPIFTHFILVPVIQCISLIPLTISGFGLREGAFIYFYNNYSIEPEIAFSVSILNYVTMILLPAILGGILSGKILLMERNEK
ncbi:MAG: flippase-like domain-containing protein [Candidatus Cloacimonetes bacterium]|nr:flippase-like domain-containing protein [Candidatus Cloacimonadota bacterium]